MSRRKQPVHSQQSPVGEYKALLRAVLENRPSGTRKRLAEVLGKNRSFVSQISNPAYRTPIPSTHLNTIIEVCHLSDQEKQEFIEAYRRAHPRWDGESLHRPAMRRVTLDVPDMGQSSMNRELDLLLSEFAIRTARLIDRAARKRV